MLGKLKAGVLCAWADLLGGEHRWCVRGALVAGAVAGWCLGALVCQNTKQWLSLAFARWAEQGRGKLLLN